MVRLTSLCWIALCVAAVGIVEPASAEPTSGDSEEFDELRMANPGSIEDQFRVDTARHLLIRQFM